MSNSNLHVRALSVMVAMNAAIVNMRLYPATSDIIKKAVDRLQVALKKIFETEKSLVFAESEQKLLICGSPLGENDTKKSQAMAFLELMQRFEVKSIELESEVESNELLTLLDLFKGKPEDAANKGGLKKLMGAGAGHIKLDQKVYVALDADKKIISNVDLKDNEIMEYLIKGSSGVLKDKEKLKKLASDPEWIKKVLRAGARHISEEGSSSKAVPGQFIKMIGSLGGLVHGPQSEGLSAGIGASLSDLDSDLIRKILVGDKNNTLGQKALDQLVLNVDDDKFEKLAAGLKNDLDRKTGQKGEAADDQALRDIYKYLMGSEKGRRLEQKIKNRLTIKKLETKNKIALLKSGLEKIIKGDFSPLLDKNISSQIEEAVSGFIERGKVKSAESVVKGIGNALLAKDENIQETACRLALEFAQKPLPDDMLLVLSHNLVRWMRSGSALLFNYKELLSCLQGLAVGLIKEKRLEDVIHILETFNLIAKGKVDKESKVTALCRDLLKDISNQAIIGIFLEKFKKDDERGKKEIVYIFAMLGEAGEEGLLDLLLNSQDAFERGDIIKILSKIGHFAPQVLEGRIRGGGPWYFMRNLLLLMGKIGNESHLGLLRPFLSHKDSRVRNEAVDSIFRIGGTSGAQCLVSAMNHADYPLMTKIISRLVDLKFKEAAAPLLVILESKQWSDPELKEKLDVEICNALGLIGNEDAIPALSKIADRKGLLHRKVHGEMVIEAAKKALELLGN